MMGKLPLGVVSPYVKMSSGGCSDPLKFYATSYCTAYGEGTCVREPPLGHGAGRGGGGAAPLGEEQPSSGPSRTQSHPSMLNRLAPRTPKDRVRTRTGGLASLRSPFP